MSENNLQRKNQKIFGINASNNQITAFGSKATTGNPVYTNDIEEIQTTAYENGWYGATVQGNAPTITDTNAINYETSYQVAYLMQKGIAEWDSKTTYYKGDICLLKDEQKIPYVIYSQIDSNKNYNPASNPDKWRALIDRVVVGEMKMYCGLTAPTGYLLCDGSAVSRIQYKDLFNVIGTYFGQGDGQTTFNLPDMRNRFPEGAGTNTLGQHIEAGIQDHKHYLINANRFYSYTGVTDGTMGNSSNSMGNNDYWLCGTNQTQTDSGNYPANLYLSSEASKTNVENTVYGKSDTVQPEATIINYIIKF